MDKSRRMRWAGNAASMGENTLDVPAGKLGGNTTRNS
jgi:hypothetical protein